MTVETEDLLDTELSEFIATMEMVFNSSRGNHYRTSNYIVDNNLGEKFIKYWNNTHHVAMVQRIFIRVHQNDAFFAGEIEKGITAEYMTISVLKRILESVDFLMNEC